MYVTKNKVYGGVLVLVTITTGLSYLLMLTFGCVDLYKIRIKSHVDSWRTRLLQQETIFDTTPYKGKLNFTFLQHNPIYKQFQIKEQKKKITVNVLVIVSSAPKRFQRRMNIRNTWWSQCVKTERVTPACIFMTDYQTEFDKYYVDVEWEKMEYGDIRFQHVEGGVTFGLRFLNHLLFAVNNYEFDYLLRSDDDQFFCMERFLQELPLPMIRNFHWGWVHHAELVTLDIRRPEESMILFSRDIIETFVMQNPKTMLCHPLADQMIAAWLSELNITKLLRHDYRIHHTPIFQLKTSLGYIMDLCHMFISIHGVYPQDMFLLWTHRGESINASGNLATNSLSFPITKKFNWTAFGERWRYEPKLCITNHQWNTRKLIWKGQTSYSGREGT